MKKFDIWQRQVRQDIRSSFLAATRGELLKALDNYRDAFSKECIREIIAEHEEALAWTMRSKVTT
jgi:hypothetical protein